ncbi:MAG: zinc ribbon domain-containing protein [Phycisphaerae bacterium]
MPIYEYTCLSCNHEFEELLRSMSAENAVRCPACRSRKVTRKPSVFAARQDASKSAGGSCSQCCDPNGPCAL